MDRVQRADRRGDRGECGRSAGLRAAREHWTFDPAQRNGATQPDEPPASTGPSVELPLLGTVDLGGSSLLVSTLLIGFADGINPCSLWVLAVLLAIVLHSGSRGRVALVGSTFLIVTAGMYGLYIVGMYSALDYAGQLGWIRAGVAVVALAFGVLQLKDGLTPGVGPSLSISPSRRPRIYRAMRGVARPDRGLTGHAGRHCGTGSRGVLARDPVHGRAAPAVDQHAG